MAATVTETEKEWGMVVAELEAKGVTPADVRKEVLKASRKEAGGGLFGWAGEAVNSPITWKGVLYLALGVMVFAGLLKLVGMAFNVNIPIIHTASA